jgi:hypothetical protein
MDTPIVKIRTGSINLAFDRLHARVGGEDGLVNIESDVLDDFGGSIPVWSKDDVPLELNEWVCPGSVATQCITNGCDRVKFDDGRERIRGTIEGDVGTRDALPGSFHSNVQSCEFRPGVLSRDLHSLVVWLDGRKPGVDDSTYHGRIRSRAMQDFRAGQTEAKGIDGKGERGTEVTFVLCGVTSGGIGCDTRDASDPLASVNTFKPGRDILGETLEDEGTVVVILIVK